jgi:N-acetylglutamate synthase-like GNAT family acetyltransferase
MNDDIDSKPNYYPWIADIYVDKPHRLRGVCRFMVQDFVNRAPNLGIHRAYLYTNHKNLFEKFGWQFLEHTTDINGKTVHIYFIDL